MIVATLPALAVPADATADWVADRVAALVCGGSAAATGVYLATRNAGEAAALGFWRRALTDGVGFASPAAFPSTLASSIATHVALRFGLKGANHSLVGGDDASAGALDAARWELADGSVARAIVVRCDFGDAGRDGVLAGMALVASDERANDKLRDDGDPIIALSRATMPRGRMS